jgi:SynChlorMet cassette radical SAM/SPASM protein ScmE
MNVMATPRSIDLSITSDCNLRCRYCSHFSSASDADRDLSTEAWLTFFEELNACAVMDVTLSGGEPFCRTDLRELIEGIVTNRMRYKILSNGTLITDRMAGFLTSTGRCNGVQVSIDGPVSEVHDAFRGEGNFEKALTGIRYLRAHGVDVDVRVTIHRQNVHMLDDIARFLLDDLGLDGFSTNSASYMGLCRHNSEQIQLSMEERTFAMETLHRLKQKYDGRISASAGPLAEYEAWSEMEQARRGSGEPVSGGGYLTGCGCLMSAMAVRADGVMIPCSQLSHLDLGRINRDDLKDIWLHHPVLTRLRERCHIALSDFEFCRGCDYVNHCTGNCPALAYTMVGDDNHPSPDACLRRFLKEGGNLPGETAANNGSAAGTVGGGR